MDATGRVTVRITSLLGRASPALVLLAAVAAAAQAPLDSCDPKLPAIYDFQVDDLFQTITHTIYMGHGIQRNEDLRKFIIASKTVEGATIRYGVRGLSRRILSGSGSIFPNPNEDTLYHSIDSPLEYQDSAGHILNACNEALVPVANDRLERHLRVRLSHAGPPIAGLPSPVKSKVLGGQGNIYRRQDDGSFVPDTSITMEYIYTASLGLVWYRFSDPVVSIRMELLGFVRNGDTTGVINPDSDFQKQPTPIRPRENTPGLHPAILGPKFRRDPFDLRGRRLLK